MNALRRLWRARAFVILVCTTAIVWSAAANKLVASTGSVVLGSFGQPERLDHALYRILELLIEHGAVRSFGLDLALALSGVGVLFTTLMGGVVFAKLDGSTWSDAVRTGVRTWAPLSVSALWHVLLLAVSVGVVFVAGQLLPPWVRLLVAWLVVSACVLARDRVRAQITLDGVPHPYGPRHTLRAIRWACVHPKHVAWVALTLAAQLAMAVGLNVVAIGALGPFQAAVWVRLIAAVGLTVGLLRLCGVLELQRAPEAGSLEVEPQNTNADPSAQPAAV